MIDINEYMIYTNTDNGRRNKQAVFKFPNGYGASLIQGPNSYGGTDGLFELAIIEFTNEVLPWSISYDTPIADDVLGYLTEDTVMDTLNQIYKLPTREMI